MSVVKVFRPVIAMNTERLESGISPSHCRNLFGPIDHEQLRNELREELGRIVLEKQRRWNFDFVNLKPLSGNFIWQRIDDNRTAGATTMASSTETTNVSEASVDMHSSTTTQVENTTGTRQASNSKANCLKTPERMTMKPKRRSPRITDYLRGKKQSRASREIKFCRHAGDERLSTKQARTRRNHCRGRTTKQSTLDELLPKLRTRHANGKAKS